MDKQPVTIKAADQHAIARGRHGVFARVANRESTNPPNRASAID
jgi:hypothetical protein